MTTHMNQILAMIERDLRKFLRSPALIMASMVFPLIQLVVLGYAFGGKVKNARVAVVDQDHGPEALRVKQLLLAIESNARTLRVEFLADSGDALQKLKGGKISALIQIPPHFSRQINLGLEPRLALVVDNTDPFVAAELQGRLQEMIRELKGPPGEAREDGSSPLDLVELYGYIEYIEYLLPGTVVLAIFVSAMIGGGIIFIDDKARGLHEGYLATPISKFSLISGFILSGTVKGILSGLALVLVGSIISGVDLGRVFAPQQFLLLLLSILLTSTALISMMFALMARVDDPMVPRSIIGILNTLLYFPSGAVYPIEGFPAWLRAVATVNPETYAVHAFKGILLKGSGLESLMADFLFLSVFSLVMITLSVLLFKRTL